MSIPKYDVKVPATTMIAGEHAVVYKGGAIACALDTFMYFSWSANQSSRIIELKSDLGVVSYDLDSKKLNSSDSKWDYFKLIMDDISLTCDLYGATINVKSDFSSKHGLGSSSAFMIGLIKLFNKYFHFDKTSFDILKRAHRLTRKKSPLASGSDLAACLYEGLVYINMRDNIVEKINTEVSQVTLTYCGYKTTTPEVLEFVKKQIERQPNLKLALDNIAELVDKIKGDFSENNICSLRANMSLHQKYLAQLGVVDQNLEAIVSSMSLDESFSAVKVSGSGMGDSVLGLGESTKDHTLGLKNSFQKVYQIYDSSLASNSVIREYARG